MKKFLVILFSSVLFLSFTSCSEEEPLEETRITSFEFKKTVNMLPASIKGVIDEESKIITVSLDGELYENSSARAALKASVEVTGGMEVVTKAADMNFSLSPVMITVASASKTVSYAVKIKKASDRVLKNSLLFTEYYNGSTYSYKNENNQFLEISNVDSLGTTLDLSEVYLNRHVWLDGVRHAELDQSVPLKGVVLESGKSLVLYSQRCSWFKNSSTNNSVFMSDRAFNGIISFSGQDAFTLTCGLTVLDALGPENGNGNGLTWGNSKQMQANARVFYKSYDESEWIMSKATGEKKDADKTAGYKDPKANDTEYKNTEGNIITYFVFENLSEPSKVQIDHASKVITINFYSDKISLVQKPVISTSGVKISLMINGKDKGRFKSNETAVDFSPSVNDDTGKLSLSVSHRKMGGESRTYRIITKITPYLMNGKTDGTYAPVSDISQIKSGDLIIFYLPSESYAVGSTVTGNYLAEFECSGVPETFQNGMASFCVTKDDDGNYTFTWKNRFLTSGETGNALLLKNAPGDYSLWKFRSAGDGLFYVDSVNAKYGASAQGLEYYASKSAFSTYTVKDDDAYKFEIYRKE
ncbi:MAG: hypothetical protein J5780_03640 [Treponema sp.]|nr:hypothetical protein [Treponema sp.]